jgi:hypothetical protein
MPLTLNFVTDCGAPTDGVTSCDTAMTSWLTQAAANDGSTLIIPAYNGIGVSSPYHLGTLDAFGNGLKNCTITAQSGATVDSLFIGHANLLTQDFTHSSRIVTTTVAATSVTLKTPAEISRYSVNQWIMVTGLGIQAGLSFPPNFEYVEFRQISSISSPSISFTAPLRFVYKDTWPLVDPTVASNYDMGGPATIYAMSADFDGTQTWSGLKVTGTGGVGINCGGGKSMTLTSMDFTTNNGPSPSMGQSFVIQNCAIGAQNEVDKCLEYLEYNNCTGTQIYCASAAPGRLVIKNGSVINTLNGTAYDTEIRDTSSLTSLIIGASGFGRSNSLLVDATASTGASPTTSTHFIDPSTMSLSSGVFSISNLANLFDFFRLWVPGFSYVYGYTAANSMVITDDVGGQVSFRCLDMTQDGSNTYVITNLVSPPSQTYQGHAANAIFAYGVASIIPANSSLASVNGALQPPFQAFVGLLQLRR